MTINNILKKSSPFFVAALLTACGGESAKEAKVGKEKEAAEGGKESVTYKLNNKKSAFQWTGRKQSGHHDGTVDMKKGQLKTEGGDLKSGKFVVDMTSIAVTDDMKSSYKKKLRSHLRDSSDFFNVDSFPTAKFELVDVKPYEGDSSLTVGTDSLKKSGSHSESMEKKATHTIEGNLSIKGTTKNVSGLPAYIDIGDKKVHALTEFSFDRTKWGINYKSKSMLDDLKEGFIYDQVDLRISLQASKSEKMAKSGKDTEKKSS